MEDERKKGSLSSSISAVFKGFFDCVLYTAKNSIWIKIMHLSSISNNNSQRFKKIIKRLTVIDGCWNGKQKKLFLF